MGLSCRTASYQNSFTITFRQVFSWRILLFTKKKKHDIIQLEYTWFQCICNDCNNFTFKASHNPHKAYLNFQIFIWLKNCFPRLMALKIRIVTTLSNSLYLFCYFSLYCVHVRQYSTVFIYCTVSHIYFAG